MSGVVDDTTRLGYWQWRTLALLWIAYAGLYLGRVNLAVALPVIQNDLQLSTASVGLISACFFWVYAVGQLVNGALGDRFSPRLFILVALVGTASMNLLFSLASSLVAMMVLWSVNGYVQSMGWGPVVRTASTWVYPSQRNVTSAFLGTSFVLGSLLSWLLSGRLLAYFGLWPYLFRIPAVLLFCWALVWWLLMRDRPEDVGLPPVTDNQQRKRPGSLQTFLADTATFLRQPFLLLLAVSTVIQGMVRDGIGFWVPMILVQSQGMEITRAISLSLFIPFMGFIGVLGASWLNKRLGHNEEKVVVYLFSGGVFLAGLTSVWLGLGDGLWLTVTIGLCSAVVNGANVLLLTCIPMRFVSTGKASTLAGFLDFANYVGAGLMAALTGVIVSLFGWAYVTLLWGVLFGLGALSMGINLMKYQSASSVPAGTESHNKPEF